MKKSLLIFVGQVTLSLAAVCTFGQLPWTTTQLSEARSSMGATTSKAGPLMWFAGGLSNSGLSSRIDIYNTETGEWTRDELSLARAFPAVVSSGHLIFFAGGINFTTGAAFDRIDIWNTQTGQWTTASLSVPRFSISALACGNKVLFAGGVNLVTGQAYNTVDIYDMESGAWSTAVLSTARAAIGATVVGNKAFFAGGYYLSTMSKQVDIYDAVAESWSTAELSQNRGFLSATTVGTKAIFAGGVRVPGISMSDRVDIFDASTNDWTTASLSRPRGFIENAATLNDKAYFIGGGWFGAEGNWEFIFTRIDIYDANSGAWTTSELSHPLVNHSVLANGTHLLVAGGDNELNFTDEVLILTGVSHTRHVSSALDLFRITPNPTQGDIRIEYTEAARQNPVRLCLYSLQGQLLWVKEGVVPNNCTIVLPDLPDGTYLLHLFSEKSVQTLRLMMF